jgi:hypothetical protein
MRLGIGGFGFNCDCHFPEFHCGLLDLSSTFVPRQLRLFCRRRPAWASAAQAMAMSTATITFIP